MLAKFTVDTSPEFPVALLGDTELETIDIREDGRVIAAIVHEQRIPFDDGLRLAPKRRSAA